MSVISVVDVESSNGVLVTENRGKGLRFTRIRLVVGDGKDAGVVYKTADYHKPWDLGLTPDAAIQAKIDDLNAQLAPILGAQIGSSNKIMPRADQCVCAFERGKNPLALAECLHGLQRFLIRRRLITNPACGQQQRVLRANARIVQARGDRMGLLNLAVLILQQHRETTLQHPGAAVRQGGCVVTQSLATSTGFNTNNSD